MAAVLWSSGLPRTAGTDQIASVGEQASITAPKSSATLLRRKNSLFYKTRNGALMGDLFMSLIHTCELNGVNPFDYLTELQRHAGELKREPSEWMPWNYRETLARLATPAAA